MAPEISCASVKADNTNAIKIKVHGTHPRHSAFPFLLAVALALHEAPQLFEGHAARLGHEPEHEPDEIHAESTGSQRGSTPLCAQQAMLAVPLCLYSIRT